MLKPKHPCASPGCRETTNAKHCNGHRQKRPSARSAGYDARWDTYTGGFLRRHNFCCDPFARHRGQIVRATVTGHKLAHKGNAQLMWNPDNHYPLCASCNAYQCVKAEGGFGNQRTQGETHSETKAKREPSVINNLGSGIYTAF